MSVVVMKCEPGKLCQEEDIVFNSENANATTDQFRGLVTLLEPDLSKKNCSVLIDDLNIWMSGNYMVGVNGVKNGRPAVVRRPLTKPIKVTGLNHCYFHCLF